MNRFAELGMVLTATVAMGLAACSPEPAAPEAPPPPQKVGREGAYDAAQGTPEAFVRALYAAYAHPPAEPVTPGRDYLLQRSLNAMILYDHKNAAEKGGQPHLKNDPVCDCDGGTVVLKSVTVTPGETNMADAAVIFTVDGVEKSQVLALEREGGRWRVKDVVRPGEKPLSEQLLAIIS